MALQGTGHVGISNYLKNTLIPSITTIRISNIYDNEVTDLQGYPAAVIRFDEIIGQILDNHRNEVIYQCKILIFIDRKQPGSENAESILRTLMDEARLKIDADPTLGGTCIYCEPFPARYGYVDRQENNLRVAELTLNCHDANRWR